jgi:hypothetical protein
VGLDSLCKGQAKKVETEEITERYLLFFYSKVLRICGIMLQVIVP